MGRWYCCNDSYVTVSTLQDVLSEKVYILFFSRTNQRPLPSGATSGVKSSNFNGVGTSKSPKIAVAPKCVDQSSCKDIPSMSKSDKVSSIRQIKLNGSGSSSRRVPPTVDRNADMHKSRNMNMDGDAKDTVYMEKLDKDMSLIINGNGCSKNKIIVDETCPSIAGASENFITQNGALDSVKPDLYEANGTMVKMVAEKGYNHLELQNSRENGHTGTSELKRKLEDSCILFAQDSHSRAKVKELKEVCVKFYHNGFTRFPYIMVLTRMWSEAMLLNLPNYVFHCVFVDIFLNSRGFDFSTI